MNAPALHWQGARFDALGVHALHGALGFATVSPPYLEDGIAHVEMLWPPA